jgi:WNK lysine deficient protein kinase
VTNELEEEGNKNKVTFFPRIVTFFFFWGSVGTAACEERKKARKLRLRQSRAMKDNRINGSRGGSPPGASSEEEKADREEEEMNVVVNTDPSGRYLKFNELLGEGAFKKVYKALDELEGKEVAWNEIQIQGRDFTAEERSRLMAEIQIGTELHHPNIISFYASWLDPETKSMVFITELFTGGTLRQYRRKYSKLNLKAIKRWSRQILEGLAYLHEEHDPPIIHRDLKCDNIFINGHIGEVKIGDLGLATLSRKTQCGMSVLGTPEFMAPEMYEEQYDELVDIYAFGMCLLELVTCQFPYKECENAAQIYRKVSSGIGPQSLAQVLEQNPSMYAFIRKCLAPRESRPTASQLLDDHFLSAISPHSRRDTRESLLSDAFASPNDDTVLGSAAAAGGGGGSPVEDPVQHMKGFIDSQVSLESLQSEAPSIDATTIGGYQSKIVQTVSQKQFGSEFKVSGEEAANGMIEIKVRMPSRTDPDKKAKSISFQFDPQKDTARKVAQEMALAFDLSTLDETICAAAIDSEIHKFPFVSSPRVVAEMNGHHAAELSEKEDSYRNYPSKSSSNGYLDTGLGGVYPKLAIENPMMEHFQALLENGEDNDILIVCGEVEFPAHKVILSARSKVLKAMLKDEKVKESGKLKLKDISPKVMKVVLFYIYTGSLPLSAGALIRDRQDEIVRASEALEMPRFKQIVDSFLKEKLEDLYGSREIPLLSHSQRSMSL